MRIIRTEKKTARRRTTCIKLALSLCLLLPLAAQDQSGKRNGVVFGTAMNATRDSSAVAGQEVILYQYIDGQEVRDFQMHTVTDDQGVFVFEELEVGDRFAYYPATMYKSVEYSGILVKPVTSALRQQSDILFFEPTTSDSAIYTAMHHLIVEPGNGVLIVREILLFANRDNHTFVGDVPTASGKNIVLRMGAPKHATKLELSGDLMSCCIVMNGNQVFDTMEFKPGTRQAVLSYELPYRGKEANLTKTIAYPTEAFDIFLSGSHVSRITTRESEKESGIVSVNQFDEHEPFEIRGKQYDRYDLGSITRGSTFSVVISNLTAVRSNYRWLAPVVLISIIIIGYLGNRKWRSKNDSEEGREEL